MYACHLCTLRKSLNIARESIALNSDVDGCPNDNHFRSWAVRWDDSSKQTPKSLRIRVRSSQTDFPCRRVKRRTGHRNTFPLPLCKAQWDATVSRCFYRSPHRKDTKRTDNAAASPPRDDAHCLRQDRKRDCPEWGMSNGNKRNRQAMSIIPSRKRESDETSLGGDGPSKKGRRAEVACHRCNKLRIRCSGSASTGTPCDNCQRRGSGEECTYPSRDKKVVVQERYIYL